MEAKVEWWPKMEISERRMELGGGGGGGKTFR